MIADVKDKISILKQHRSAENGRNYITIHSMVNYELGCNITVVKGKPPSGSRTLLRLHRALEFMMVFLRNISEPTQDEKLSVTAYSAYQSTLSKHHTWLIRKAVGLAIYTLPTTDHFLENMHCESTEAAKEQIEHLVNECQIVYDSVQRLYVDNNLLNLP